jgi:hypothetical protein
MLNYYPIREEQGFLQTLSSARNRNILLQKIALIQNYDLITSSYFKALQPIQYKVLARPSTFFQLSLSCATFFQLFTFVLLISSKTPSSQRVLGLLIGRIDMGFHLLIFCTPLSSVILSTCPNQFSLCF